MNMSREEETRMLLPFTLAQSDRYAWKALGAQVRGDGGSVVRFTRLSRMTRRIADEVYRVEALTPQSISP